MTKCMECKKYPPTKHRFHRKALIGLCARCAKKYDMAKVLTTFKIQRSYKHALISTFGSLQDGLTHVIEKWVNGQSS